MGEPWASSSTHLAPRSGIREVAESRRWMDSRAAGESWGTGQLPTVLGGRCKNSQRLAHRINMSTATFGEETGTTKGNQAPRKDMTDKDKCYRRMLRISWKDRKTNKFVQRGIKARAGQQGNLLGIVKRRKFAWFGHISRHNSLAKTVLQGTQRGLTESAEDRLNVGPTT